MSALSIGIKAASASYEGWMSRHTSVVSEDLKIKHQRMSESPFRFLRATYYRWVQRFPEVCSRLVGTPKVLAIGDLHIENFGTWRDSDGRLIWGVNDFDETYPSPYTNDLVRLAASAFLAIEADHLQVTKKSACKAILEGYSKQLLKRGRPFVLAESHPFLRGIAREALRDPQEFWARLSKLPAPPGDIPKPAKQALESMMPEKGFTYSLMARVAGMGSLGRPRFVALAEWRGGKVARETKPLIPSAHIWQKEEKNPQCYYERIISKAIRVPDPFMRVHHGWIVRRLAPDCAKIELAQLPLKRDEKRLLRAMGCETANIHLATASQRPAILRDLHHRDSQWLYDAASKMAVAVGEDWQEWVGNDKK